MIKDQDLIMVFLEYPVSFQVWKVHTKIQSKVFHNRDAFQIFTRVKFQILSLSEVGCVLLMVIVHMLPHAVFGLNDHREYALHFKCYGNIPDSSEALKYMPHYIPRLILFPLKSTQQCELLYDQNRT